MADNGPDEEGPGCCGGKCSCASVDKNPLPPNPTCPQKCCHAFRCPPHGGCAFLLSILLFALLLLGAIIGLFSEANLFPTLISLFVLLVIAHIAGYAVTFINMPPLLGMLITGFLLKNIPVVKDHIDFDSQWSSALRSIALLVILTRAGIGLDPAALKRLSLVVLRLAFLPCFVEAAVMAVVSHLLMGLPIAWGFVLGFVLAAVTPAVVVPSMITCQEKGLGVVKGIPTLVIAAASIDDVAAIAGYSVAIGIAFDTGGNIAFTIIRGPLEVIIGILYGIVIGLMLWLVPNFKSDSHVAFRFLLMLGSGLFATFVSLSVGWAGAGALGVLTAAFVANLGWRGQGGDFADDDTNPINNIFGQIWDVMAQPLLFGLIGAEIDASTLEPGTVGVGIGCLMIAVFFRMIASFLVVLGAGFNLKEKLFIPFAWLPKATVQAAIGAAAFDMATKAMAAAKVTLAEEIENFNASAPNATYPVLDPEYAINIQRGEQVLTLAVLSIIITAPIGAVLIAIFSNILLTADAKADPKEAEAMIAKDTETGI